MPAADTSMLMPFDVAVDARDASPHHAADDHPSDHALLRVLPRCAYFCKPRLMLRAAARVMPLMLRHADV
jgi:hypothetical protein